MKAKRLLVLIIAIIASVTIAEAEKFDLKLNIEKGDKFTYKTVNASIGMVDGEEMSSDTTEQIASFEIIEKSNNGYKSKHLTTLNTGKKTETKDMEIKLVTDSFGKFLSLDEDKVVLEKLFESFTFPMKMFVNMMKDSVKKQETLNEIDSVFRLIFTHDRLLKVAQHICQETDLSLYQGMEIGKSIEQETRYFLFNLGEVKSKRSILIEKDETGKSYIITTTDVLDGNDYIDKTIKIAELKGDKRSSRYKSKEITYITEKTIHVDIETGIITYKKVETSNKSINRKFNLESEKCDISISRLVKE